MSKKDAASEPAARLVRCPTCRKSVRYDLTNPFRPFCGASCKNQDIVAWAEEGFRIAGEAVNPDDLPQTPRQRQEEEDQ